MTDAKTIDRIVAKLGTARAATHYAKRECLTFSGLPRADLRRAVERIDEAEGALIEALCELDGVAR